MDAVQEAAEKGDVGEDDSHGYSVAHNPTLRAKQLAMHEYAVTHVRIVEIALRGSSLEGRVDPRGARVRQHRLHAQRVHPPSCVW